ncbi:hypothetical protein P154DRAFT_527090 [Amniculicola lignicola CBS 123094]|uniref:Uncharacterized protein n=1 Tax=Amniculicola lignicola CBS 123094 TaxID=1392246 RepID=A0A6A5W5Q9_9PLEO|nr:hypothetical protein P154DRAFT_527090 [Amniculicola lignicola CBS 123094]
MASKSTEEPGSSTTSAPGTILLLPHLSFRDRVRMALFLVIPVYARVFLFSSVSVTFWHLYIVGTTGVSIAHFSKGNIGLASVWDVLYGLLEASFPSWGASILWFLWIDHGIVGWRWEVIYWIGVPRRLAYLLPELYGSDVKVGYRVRLL